MYLVCQTKMLRETLVAVQQLLEVFLKLADSLAFAGSFQLSLLKQTVLLRLLLGRLDAGGHTETHTQIPEEKNKNLSLFLPTMTFHFTLTFQAQR